MPPPPAITLSSRTAFQGRVFAVSIERVRLPHGREVNMEVVRHPASVILLPMPDSTHVVLVHQYRFPIDRWIWELPAGSLEPGRTRKPPPDGNVTRRLGRLRHTSSDSAPSTPRLATATRR